MADVNTVRFFGFLIFIDVVLIVNTFGTLEDEYAYPMVTVVSAVAGVYYIIHSHVFISIVFFSISYISYWFMKDIGGGSLFKIKLPLPRWMYE